LTPADQVGDPQELEVTVAINEETRQEGNTAYMIFSVAHLVHYTSTIFTLEPGDLIYTGTPDGVGPVKDGDVAEARVTGCAPLRVRMSREVE